MYQVGLVPTKRISDAPILVNYVVFDPHQAQPGDTIDRRFLSVQRMRTEGAGLLEPW